MSINIHPTIHTLVPPLSNTFSRAGIVVSVSDQVTQYSDTTPTVLKISVLNQNGFPECYSSFIVGMAIDNDTHIVCIVVTDADDGTKHVKSVDKPVTYFDQQSNVDQVVTDIIMSCNAYMFANK